VDRPAARARRDQLYSLVEHFIKPKTKWRKCSMVELVADGPQPPRVFVSHAWGESVKDFITCLEQFVEDHGDNDYDDDTPFWVCAYANNQHNIDGELSGDVASSPFVRALFVADGMVTIVDKEGAVFTRAWCAYELYTATVRRGADFFHDIYTAGTLKNGYGVVVNAVGLVSGFAKSDDGLSGLKALREYPFPKPLIEAALRFDLLTSEASMEEDKAAIEADVGDRVAVVNATVRAFVGAALLPNLLEGEDLPRLGALLAELRASALPTLSFRSSAAGGWFWGCKAAPASASRQLGEALPDTLSDLRVHGIGAGAVGGIAARIASGQLLHLELRSCRLGNASARELGAALGTGGAQLLLLKLWCAWLGPQQLMSGAWQPRARAHPAPPPPPPHRVTFLSPPPSTAQGKLSGRCGLGCAGQGLEHNATLTSLDLTCARRGAAVEEGVGCGQRLRVAAAVPTRRSGDGRDGGEEGCCCCESGVAARVRAQPAPPLPLPRRAASPPPSTPTAQAKLSARCGRGCAGQGPWAQRHALHPHPLVRAQVGGGMEGGRGERDGGRRGWRSACCYPHIRCS
jgi:hypothetical protein